jgi:hypothetical protein
MRGGEKMKALVFLVILALMISVVGCEKKNSISITGQDGKTSSVTVR